ncbi:MAG: hypothetical protein SH850_15400 [Planctomycetaceae bacterium]|nr:hypothetical protein [Planctomycetaceae bacterium]
MQKQDRSSFAVCVAADGSDDLRVWKLYRVQEDREAEREGYLRVVDESGEDYLYSASRFVIVEFPEAIERQLLTASSPVA